MAKCKEIQWNLERLYEACNEIIDKLHIKDCIPKESVIYGIARGGLIPAYIISNETGVDYFPIYRIKNTLIENPHVNPKYKNIFIIDDRAQSGTSSWKSKNDAFKAYSKFHEEVNIKMGLLSALELCYHKADCVHTETKHNEKIYFPWDNAKIIEESGDQVFKEGVREFKRAHYKIESEIKEDPSRFFNLFSPYEEGLLKEFHKNIIKSHMDEFKIRGELVDINSFDELWDGIIRIKSSGKIDSCSYKETVLDETEKEIDVFIDEDKFKNSMINFTVKDGPVGLTEFSMEIEENGFGRCEPTRYEPHYSCKDLCKFKPENRDGIETFNCFGIVNSLAFLQKLKKEIGTVKVTEIIKK